MKVHFTYEPYSRVGIQNVVEITRRTEEMSVPSSERSTVHANEPHTAGALKFLAEPKFGAGPKFRAEFCPVTPSHRDTCYMSPCPSPQYST